MSLPSRLMDRLCEDLAGELDMAASGHCMRVDYLDLTTCRDLCQKLREKVNSNKVGVFVLDTSGNDGNLAILPEKAIELRNRKALVLCLFIPAGLVDATASSLANSFAVFDLEAWFRRVSKNLLTRLPEEVRGTILQVRAQLRGATTVSDEQWADYLGAVLEAPSLESAGRELWRVGLIPDVGGEGLAERLADNRRCAIELVRPTRAQTSAAERIDAVALRGGAVRDELLAYLSGERLRDARTWLQKLVNEPYKGRISFERWSLSQEASDLEEIELEPLLDPKGKVQSYSKLQQPGGDGTQPVAPVGPKKTVIVKWISVPGSPSNLKRWRAELIPSRQEYAPDEAGGVDLPSATAGGKARRISVPLDIDLDSLPPQVRAVQVRIVGLDEHGSELRDGNGKVVEGLSDEFWVSEEQGPLDKGTRTTRETVPTLPFGRLKAAVELPVDALEEAPGIWMESDLHYFTVNLSGRRVVRLGLSAILKSIEERCLRVPEEAGRYFARVDGIKPLDPVNDLQPLGWEVLGRGTPGQTLLARRKEFFQELSADPARGCVETARWDHQLIKRARSYADSFRRLLDSGLSGEALAQALTIDTVELELEQVKGSARAVVLLPTHPLRALWFAAYSDLMKRWEEEVLRLPKKDRRGALELDLAQRVTPLNIPALIPTRHGVFIFTQNLRTFWGLFLPLESREPARLAAEVSRIVGLPGDEASLADLPPKRLVDELQAYGEIHPYMETLRVNILNPGSGAFMAQALRAMYERQLEEEDEQEPSPPLRVEILAHSQEPLPSDLPALTRLQQELYEAQPRGRRSYLFPLFSVALRPLSRGHLPPGGDVNVTLALDQLAPHVELVSDPQKADSSSFYGLFMRFLPRFRASEGEVVWEHRLSLPQEIARERHPVVGTFTNELIDNQRSFLSSVGRLIAGDGVGGDPAVTVRLTSEDVVRIDAVHHVSDWVITLDRFLGVEYFDDPRDAHVARVSRKYLLDYAPEFLEGLGHRMLVTTSHREEVEEMLARAMRDLGFGLVEESVGEVLDHLKTISGRLALRILGDDARAREAVSLGVVTAYLRAKGELEDAILIPVDSHPELFAPHSRRKIQGTTRARCDLIRVRFLPRRRVLATFIEVKSRAAAGQSEELLERIVDQIEATEGVFRDLFFRTAPPRLDHVLQRSRLATILHFYLRRAWRHGLVASEERFAEMVEAINRLESSFPDVRVERWGFVVNLTGRRIPPARLRDSVIRFITADDLLEAGLSVTTAQPDAKPPYESPTPGTAVEANATEPTIHSHSRTIPPKKNEHSSSDKASAVDLDPQPAMPVEVLGEPAETASSTADRSPTTVQVELGLTVGNQEPVDWRIGVRGSPHLFILGIPGQGKSWTIARILGQFARQGLPCLVFDFHGQFADSQGPYFGLGAQTIMDASRGLPFSPFEADVSVASGASYWRTNAFAVAEIFQYVCELGDIQRDVVFEALRDCYVDLGFEDGSPKRLPTIAEFSARLTELESERGVKNVVPRCRPLLEFGLFRDVPEVELRDLLVGGLVLDVHQLGLESLQLAAGAFLLRKVYKDMFRWGESDRLRLAIVLDEGHRLAKDVTLPKIMKEGRKFGIAVVVASQGLSDFHQDVVGNAGTKVVFRTNFPMSKKVAGFLRARKGFDLAAAIEQLDVGEAYIQTPDMPSCGRVHMHPLK
ncbi:MAG: helicase HerA domain-containing protein [Gammaproteobacteria bacterium]